jgi:hypothetical protein
MAAFPTISERGESFIDTATVVSAMVEKHCKSKKPVDESTLKYLEGQKWTYKDVQDLWKIAHVKDETMPIVRGKNSLRQAMK